MIDARHQTRSLKRLTVAIVVLTVFIVALTVVNVWAAWPR